jgi:hypothetical protein
MKCHIALSMQRIIICFAFKLVASSPLTQHLNGNTERNVGLVGLQFCPSVSQGMHFRKLVLVELAASVV